MLEDTPHQHIIFHKTFFGKASVLSRLKGVVILKILNILANLICLDYEKRKICGTEYEYPLQCIHDINAPCSVCHVSTKSAIIMIPSKTTSPLDWA